jgi:hypothetical protein
MSDEQDKEPIRVMIELRTTPRERIECYMTAVERDRLVGYAQSGQESGIFMIMDGDIERKLFVRFRDVLYIS